MHLRTRYRFGMIPSSLLLASTVALVALALFPATMRWLDAAIGLPSWTWFALAGLVPAVLLGWYMFTFVDVQRGRLSLCGLRGSTTVNLRRLDYAELISFGGRGAGIVVRLADLDDNEVYLPLGPWRDEELLVAMILRATVSRRVKIEGDAEVVEIFTNLKDTYRSWDRRQAA